MKFGRALVLLIQVKRWNTLPSSVFSWLNVLLLNLFNDFQRIWCLWNGCKIKLNITSSCIINYGKSLWLLRYVYTRHKTRIIWQNFQLNFSTLFTAHLVTVHTTLFMMKTFSLFVDIVGRSVEGRWVRQQRTVVKFDVPNRHQSAILIWSLKTILSTVR